jgi:SEC-C motif domain protein
MIDPKKKCPCHSQKSYEECCKRYHDGVPAENALLLMRSRYSAYALHLADYIIQTTYHPNSAINADIAKWKKEILEFSQATDFTGLQIIDFHEKTDSATVTFLAILEQNHRDVSFTEKSHFIKMNNQWFFLEPTKQ